MFGKPSARPACGWPDQPATSFAVICNVLQNEDSVVNWQLPGD